MKNEIESFMCLLMNTQYLHKLLFSDKVEKYADVVEILESWEKFSTVDDIKKLNNKHINKAIEEFENNEELMKVWKE